MKFVFYLMLLAFCALMSSCSTTQKFTVVGNPNTEIYAPDGAKIGQINSSGKAKLELPSDAYYAYLLSKSQDSNDLVPFALDFKKKSYNGCKTACVVGLIGLSEGIGALLTGGIMLIADSELALGPILAAAGGGAALSFGGIYSSTQARLDQLDHAYQFQYMNAQKTNSDIAFTRPVPEEVIATKPNDELQVGTFNLAEKKIEDSQKSTKSLNKLSSKVEGEYRGTGILTLNGEVIERYSNMKIAIKSISNNEVKVSVYENDGTQFFETSDNYSVKKESLGAYKLLHTSINGAVIKISRNKKVSFIHPKVNIDGDNYILTISSN